MAERAAARGRGEDVSDSEGDDPDAGLTLRQRSDKEKRLEKEVRPEKDREAKEKKEQADQEMADRVRGKADAPDAGE